MLQRAPNQEHAMSLLDQRPPFRTVDDESGLQIADELRRHGESSKKNSELL